MPQNWIEFWQRKSEFDDVMITNFRFFLSKVEKYVLVDATKKVLDIGSGPGHLEDAWHNRVAEIHGLDVSDRYNKMAAEKHVHHPNIFFHPLQPTDFLNFSSISHYKFDIIIVMSVLQYYPNKEAVKQLLQNIKEVSAPGTQVLLCDLMVSKGMLKDIFSVLWQSLKTGNFFSTVQFFFRLRFSKYYDIKKKHGFLIIPKNEWLALLSELHLKAQFVPEPITLQKDRASILIKMP
jgi:2-polyprenyl-3-methyl-5-hydroxy-6-metoxy-1,4-benzoquinol methylase